MSCALFFSLKLSFLLLLFFSLLICHLTNDKGLLLILIPSNSSPPYVKRMSSTCLWDTLFLVVFYDKFIPNLLHWKIHVLCAGSFIKSYTSYRFILSLMDGVCVPTLVCKYFSVVCVHNQYSHVEKERLISSFLLKLFSTSWTTQYQWKPLVHVYIVAWDTTRLCGSSFTDTSSLESMQVCSSFVFLFTHICRLSSVL